MLYLFDYFVRFKRLVGRKVYYILALMFIVGFFEGIGITLFFPVLQGGFGDDRLSAIMRSALGFFGLEYSFNLILLLIAAFFVFRGIANLLYANYFGRVSTNLIVDLRRATMEKIFRADYSYILKKEVGYVNNALVREIGLVVDAFSTFASVLSYVLYGAIYIALAMLLNYKMALAAIIVGVVFGLAMKGLNLLTSQASLEYSASHGRLHSVLIQALSKIKYLKSTMAGANVSRMVNRESRTLGGLQFRLFFLQHLTRQLLETIVVLMVVGLLFYQVGAMGNDVAEVIFLSLLFLQVSRQFINAHQGYRKFLASKGSIETFKSFDRELDENRENLNPGGVGPDFDSDIILDGVGLVFPNGKEALTGINMRIRPKATVAFVGHSGSGKSTVANMITGLLKPTSGAIRLCDTDYGEVNMIELRKKIGYVTQEDIIFNADIKDNISLWDDGLDRERLLKVIEMAKISDFVNAIPEREQALLGDNGLNISGGQRQRITIARELYKQTKLLILDEATSSLDSKSEKGIYENLKEYKGEKTMIVIAHRLSTIKNADQIYVFEDGRVIEGGGYEELLNKRGIFKNMIDDQTLVGASREGAIDKSLTV